MFVVRATIFVYDEPVEKRVYADVGGSLDQGGAAAWRALITSNALVLEKIERALAEAGLPPLGWYDVLVELSGAPRGRLRMHELARAVVLSRSGLTRLVDRLEGAGLLGREPDPADRRGSYAAITADGRSMLRRMWPVYAAGIAEHFARHLTDEEARVVASVLGRVADAARAR
ncbi:MAG: Transcriptional regulator, MarR family [uncultured Rubrobacteraceae bacterium]|uniref:Transcriptional regulator, MarR family n=1 Tax=uncultured Rubrobacteraceae bacterium TaxID=349277 RepID=A0A6J4S6Q6_9ACTN|nr:MAG: Transcriptional regulator, MarR family [uncultured Rubrobacteraceae bacterium]